MGIWGVSPISSHFHIPNTTVSSLIATDFVINWYGAVVPTSISIPTDSRSQQPMLLFKISDNGLIGETQQTSKDNNQNQSPRNKQNQRDMTYGTNPVHRWWTMALMNNGPSHFEKQKLGCTYSHAHSVQWPFGVCPSWKLESVPEVKGHVTSFYTSLQVKAENDRKHLYFMRKTMKQKHGVPIFVSTTWRSHPWTGPVKHIVPSWTTQSGHQTWPAGKSSILV